MPIVVRKQQGFKGLKIVVHSDFIAKKSGYACVSECLKFSIKMLLSRRWCVETLIILPFFFLARLCPEYFLRRVCVEANGLVSVGLSAPVCVFFAHSAVFIKHLLCTALPERN